MKIKLTVLALFTSMLLTAQALAFYVGGFSYSVIGGTNDVEVYKCTANPCFSSDIVIPATVVDSGITYSVTTIRDIAFRDKALTSVIIPDSVTTIGVQAFQNNELTSVTIGNSVTTIGDDAFQTNDLTSVIIPDSVTTIGNRAFGSNALTSVFIPDGVTTIGSYAFYGNHLTSVIIPDSVTTIGNRAFDDNALTSVAFKGNFGTFHLSMFSGNSALATITYCDGKTVWPQTFSGIPATPISCPFHVGGFRYTVIGATTNVEVTGRASGNTDTVINIPATASDGTTTYSVTTIGDQAFYNNALTSVTIGNSVTTIGAGAFGANSLTSVIIPDSVTTIGQVAFFSNDLTSVTIGNSVTTIGDGAFADNALTSVAFKGNFGTFFPSMFSGNSALLTITYCSETTGWPQNFNNGLTIVVTAPIGCSPPDAPTIDSIVPGHAQAAITFTPGAENGSPITGYTAFCFGDTFNFDASPTSPITVSGLTNGVSYACAVTAANDVGTSPSSAVSAPFVPLPPGC